MGFTIFLQHQFGSQNICWGHDVTFSKHPTALRRKSQLNGQPLRSLKTDWPGRNVDSKDQTFRIS